ncbi:MAG: hypothetical protein HZA88_10740 [Verrucomicrobia bacterium]|nr:hypothetical protein [Verrucomicrobiota bacterium]
MKTVIRNLLVCLCLAAGLVQAAEKNATGPLQLEVPDLNEMLHSIKPDQPDSSITFADFFIRFQRFIQKIHKTDVSIPIYLTPIAAGRTLAVPKLQPPLPEAVPPLFQPVKRIPVADAIRYLCDCLGLRFRFLKEGVIIWDASEKTR